MGQELKKFSAPLFLLLIQLLPMPVPDLQSNLSYLPNGGCGVVSFELKGGRAAAETFMKHLKLAAIETHVADARTCCLNPATSTHRQMNDEQLAAAGVPAAAPRATCGTSINAKTRLFLKFLKHKIPMLMQFPVQPTAQMESKKLCLMH